MGGCLLYVRTFETAAGTNQQQELASIAAVHFSYQVAFSFLMPIRENLGQGVVRYLVHDTELSK